MADRKRQAHCQFDWRTYTDYIGDALTGYSRVCYSVPMFWQHRSLVLVVVIAALLVGIGAGVKIAQITEKNNDSRIRITIADHGQTSANKPAQISPNFYRPTAPTKPQIQPAKSSQPKPPADPVSAEAYIAGNLATGDVYFEKNADAVLPFASMSKLITALVETNMFASDTPITIPPGSDTIPGDISGIHSGETYTAAELIYPLLMTSSNVAAEAFVSAASTTDRAGFMSLMNGYSWEIGMPHAFFADPSGLDDKNAGTARGFLAMAQYLYKSRPDILAVTRIATTTFATTTDHGAHTLVNIHPFVDDPRFLGGKTGHTYAALYTMLTILKIQNQPIALIVLRSSDRAKDTALLADRLVKQGLKQTVHDPITPAARTE